MDDALRTWIVQGQRHPVALDWVVRYDNHFFQLEPQSRHYAPARGKVWVCEGRYGSMTIEYGGRALQALDFGKETKVDATGKPSVAWTAEAS